MSLLNAAARAVLPRRETRAASGRVDAVCAEAEEAAKTGGPEAAQRVYQKAHDRARQDGSDYEVAALLTRIGYGDLSASRLSAAHASFDEALDLLKPYHGRRATPLVVQTRAHATLGMAQLCRMEERYEESARLAASAEQEFKRLGQTASSYGARLVGARSAAIRGHWELARLVAEQCVDYFERTDDREHLAWARWDLSQALAGSGDLQGAREQIRQALELWREEGVSDRIAAGLVTLGFFAAAGEENREQAECLFEALRRRAEIADRRLVAYGLNNLATVLRYRGHLDEAASLHGESLRMKRDLADRWGATYSLEGLSSLAAERGDFARAAALLGAAEAIRAEIGAVREAFLDADIERTEALARAALGAEGFEAARSRVAEMDWLMAAEYALTSNDRVSTSS